MCSGVGEGELGGLGLSLVNVGIQGGGGLLWCICVLLLLSLLCVLKFGSILQCRMHILHFVVREGRGGAAPSSGGKNLFVLPILPSSRPNLPLFLIVRNRYKTIA